MGVRASELAAPTKRDDGGLSVQLLGEHRTDARHVLVRLLVTETHPLGVTATVGSPLRA